MVKFMGSGYTQIKVVQFHFSTRLHPVWKMCDVAGIIIKKCSERNSPLCTQPALFLDVTPLFWFPLFL